MNINGFFFILIFITILFITYNYLYYENINNPQIKLHIIINIYTKDKEYV